MATNYNYRRHWNEVYRQKTPDQLSWYQEIPELSLEWITSFGLNKNAMILDVGGGISTLVDQLLARNYTQLHILDIADQALQLCRDRLAGQAELVSWHCDDVLDFNCSRKFKVWHDRAVFHFLNEPEQQAAYVAQMQRLLEPRAKVILATFALDGPSRCSALPVTRYSPETLEKVLGPAFVFRQNQHVIHTTPWGDEQAFEFSQFAYHPDSP